MNQRLTSRLAVLALALAPCLVIGCKLEPKPRPVVGVISELPPSNAAATINANSTLTTGQGLVHPAGDAPVQPASFLQPAPVELVPAPLPLPQPPAFRLSLFDAVEMALAQNPDLTALRYAEGASEGALGVAQTYPFNPWVQVQVLPASDNPTGIDDTTAHYVLLMQQLQLAHQRRHRTDAAAAALNSVRWNFVAAKLANMAQTQRLYFAALYQHELAVLSAAQAQLNGELLAVSERQLAAGQITGADVAIARLDFQAARRQQHLAEANAQTALLDLRRHLGLPLDAGLELAGRLGDWQWHTFAGPVPHWLQFIEGDVAGVVDQHSLARTLAAGRPDVAAACSDVLTAQANFNLARANRVPDLIVGPYYQRDDDSTTQYGLRAQMDIPVLNTGNPLVRQRLAELTQRQAIWEQLLIRASLEAETALDRYERALAVARELGPTGGQLPPELVKLEEQFRAQEVDLTRVVVARTSYFQSRRAELDTLNELAQASAGVVAATGLPPQALIEASP
jgi:cobalt-zinc-cadmium efflux system outer membrane protein